MTTTSEAVRGDVVTVRWKCCHVVDKPSRFAWHMAFGLCRETFTATTTRSDFNAREARARCPSCGGMLTQRSDGCELVSDPGSTMQAK